MFWLKAAQHITHFWLSAWELALIQTYSTLKNPN
jgi:hypothetical protein